MESVAAGVERRRVAMRDYVRGFLAVNPSKNTRLGPDTIAGMKRIRAECRKSEGGGGMCHLVTEFLENQKGWQRLGVTYLSKDGEIVCAGHYVSLLPDGRILDPTADQFGEGHDVRILEPDDPEYGRYRPEFYSDFHPGHPDFEPELLAGWAVDWQGRDDFQMQDDIRSQRGYGWWVDEPEALLAYCREQLTLAGGGEGYGGWLDACIADIEARFVATPRAA